MTTDTKNTADDSCPTGITFGDQVKLSPEGEVVRGAKIATFNNGDYVALWTEIKVTSPRLEFQLFKSNNTKITTSCGTNSCTGELVESLGAKRLGTTAVGVYEDYTFVVAWSTQVHTYAPWVITIKSFTYNVTKGTYTTGSVLYNNPNVQNHGIFGFSTLSLDNGFILSYIENPYKLSTYIYKAKPLGSDSADGQDEQEDATTTAPSQPKLPVIIQIAENVVASDKKEIIVKAVPTQYYFSVITSELMDDRGIYIWNYRIDNGEEICAKHNEEDQCKVSVAHGVQQCYRYIESNPRELFADLSYGGGLAIAWKETVKNVTSQQYPLYKAQIFNDTHVQGKQFGISDKEDQNIYLNEIQTIQKDYFIAAFITNNSGRAGYVVQTFSSGSVASDRVYQLERSDYNEARAFAYQGKESWWNCCGGGKSIKVKTSSDKYRQEVEGAELRQVYSPVEGKAGLPDLLSEADRMSKEVSTLYNVYNRIMGDAVSVGTPFSEYFLGVSIGNRGGGFLSFRNEEKFNEFTFRSDDCTAKLSYYIRVSDSGCKEVYFCTTYNTFNLYPSEKNVYDMNKLGLFTRVLYEVQDNHEMGFDMCVRRALSVPKTTVLPQRQMYPCYKYYIEASYTALYRQVDPAVKIYNSTEDQSKIILKAHDYIRNYMKEFKKLSEDSLKAIANDNAWIKKFVSTVKIQVIKEIYEKIVDSSLSDTPITVSDTSRTCAVGNLGLLKNDDPLPTQPDLGGGDYSEDDLRSPAIAFVQLPQAKMYLCKPFFVGVADAFNGPPLPCSTALSCPDTPFRILVHEHSHVFGTTDGPNADVYGWLGCLLWMERTPEVTVPSGVVADCLALFTNMMYHEMNK